MMLFKKIAASKEYRQIAKNFFNFTIFQFSNYLIPLITIPYIIRVVGIEKFGIISLAQAVAYYFRVVVEYGFPISGVQYVAQNQSNPKKLSEIYSNIMFIQFLLMLSGAVLLAGISLIIPDIRGEWFVFFAAYGIVPANILMALWFYIGSEHMKYLNYINFSGRIVYILLIFWLVREQKNYVLVPLLNSGSLFLAGLVSLTIIKTNFKLSFLKPTKRLIRQYLKDGWALFVSNFTINFYRNSNIIILGIFASKEAVGMYSAVEKIIKIIQTIFSPLTRTLYPYISRITVESEQKSVNAISKVLKIMALVSVFVTFILIVFAPWIVKLVIGQWDAQAVTLLRIGSIVVIFGVINYIIGIIFMTNFGLKKQFSKAVVIVGLGNLLICSLLSKYFGALGTVISFTMVEVLLFVFLSWFTKRNSRWNVLKFFLP